MKKIKLYFNSLDDKKTNLVQKKKEKKSENKKETKKKLK